MKYILLVLLLPFAAQAQKDFDYTVYTTKCKAPLNLWMDTASSPLVTSTLFELTIPRKIQKDGNILKIISLTNTGDCITYTLHFIGFNSDPKNLYTIVYVDDRQQTITINPILPLITIGSTTYY